MFGYAQKNPPWAQKVGVKKEMTAGMSFLGKWVSRCEIQDIRLWGWIKKGDAI